jgi:hypothetical protein
MEYKNYLIEERYTYTDGKADFQVYEKDADSGFIRPRTTLEEIKEEINEITEERYANIN